MIEKVVDCPEIWKIIVDLPGNALKNLNSYVIKTANTNMIIDTGFNRPECRKALWDGINELQLDMDKTVLFLTHLHSDHTGLVEDFVNHGCKIYMGKVDYDMNRQFLNDDFREKLLNYYVSEGMPRDVMMRQTTYNQGAKYMSRCDFKVHEVEDGEIIWLDSLKLQCIATPGHTPGHMMLYIPEAEILFTGDHVLFDITPNITVWDENIHSLNDYMNSLKKTKELPVKIALPAHRGKHISLNERIDEILEHHEERLNEIMEALRENPDSDAYMTASKVTWSMKGLKWEEAPDGQKWFAMGETVAHLDYLMFQGKVVKTKVDGVSRYRLV